MFLFDSTNTILGAVPLLIPPRSAWMPDNRYSESRLLAYVESIPAHITHLVLDVELPDVMAMDARNRPLADVRAGCQFGVAITRFIREIRPDIKIGWYDSFVDDYTAVAESMEAKIRRTAPRDDKQNEWFTTANASKAFTSQAWLEWANDQLSELHDAQDFIVARAYFPHSADEPWKREGMIRWAWREGCRQANGKPVLLLYKPNRQDPNGKRANLSDVDIAADVAVMRSVGVKNVAVWSDGVIPSTRIKAVAMSATAARVEMQK